jgi:acyl-CoA thioesterase
MAIWARVVGEEATTPAKLGFLADMVPVTVARACGVLGAGTSLDNSMRVGALVDTEWVLLELIAHTSVAGLGHGEAWLWSPEGTLLATASQTAKLFALERRTGTPGPRGPG